MYETNMTAIGRVASRPQEWRFNDGSLKVSFRVASTERRFDRNSGTWGDGPTLFLSVICRRALAENAAASLVVGDPVIVHGRLVTRQYEKDGRNNSVVEMEATAVGPDLVRCTTVVRRSVRAGSAAAAGPAGEAVPGAVPASPGPGEGAASGTQPGGSTWDARPLVQPEGEPAEPVLVPAGAPRGSTAPVDTGAGEAAVRV
jgi:single-strand DNA-binding protein